jgi:hypothetical protein
MMISLCPILVIILAFSTGALLYCSDGDVLVCSDDGDILISDDDSDILIFSDDGKSLSSLMLMKCSFPLVIMNWYSTQQMEVPISPDDGDMFLSPDDGDILLSPDVCDMFFPMMTVICSFL